MKSTLEQLSKNERDALARFYETDGYKALKRLIEIERLEIAKDHVDVSDIMMIRYLSGQAQSLKKLINTLTENYKQKG
jgi:hypothetical protein